MKQNPFDPYTTLANAIVVQAVDDYRKARRKLKRKPYDNEARATCFDIERFFFSGYFRILTKVNPEYLMENLEKELG